MPIACPYFWQGKGLDMLTADDAAILRMAIVELREEVALLRKEVLALTEAKREADEADKRAAEVYAALQADQGGVVL